MQKYQQKFKYIFVDEFQDTNRGQFELLNLLAGLHKNLCVVGDEDQSIYSWRGADIHNILDFNKAFPDSKLVKLEQNYRSTQTIISASSQVIACNRGRSGKMLWTENEEGDLIEVHECEDEKAEGNYEILYCFFKVFFSYTFHSAHPKSLNMIQHLSYFKMPVVGNLVNFLHKKLGLLYAHVWKKRRHFRKNF